MFWVVLVGTKHATSVCECDRHTWQWRITSTHPSFDTFSVGFLYMWAYLPWHNTTAFRSQERSYSAFGFVCVFHRFYSHKYSTVPQLAAKGSQAAKSKSTTTISHTFAEYNTVITIYVIGPVSLLFLVRVNRTLCDHTLSQYKRKIVLIMLLAMQYTTLVVVRDDTIKGKTHYLFTGLTFFLLLLYHGRVSNAIQRPFVDFLKPSLWWWWLLLLLSKVV